MSVTFTHTPNWYCLYVGCPNCPYREGYLCLYDEKKYDG